MRIARIVLALLVIAPLPAVAAVGNVPSISSGFPSYTAPVVTTVQPAAPAEVRAQDDPGGGGWGASPPPTGDVTDADSGLMTWLQPLFKADGWFDSAKDFALTIAGGFIALLVVLRVMQSFVKGEKVTLDVAFGGALGTYISAIPMLVFITKFNVIANLGIQATCTSSMSAGASGGVPAGGTDPSLVCAGQLNPVGIVELGWKMIVQVMSMPIPVPQQGTGGAWSWILAPIAAMGDNVLASMIAWSTSACIAACLFMVAIELLMLSFEALFVTGLAPAFLGFHFFQPLAHLADGAKKYLPNFCVRLFFELLPIGLGFKILNSEMGILQAGNVTFPDLLLLVGSTIFYIIATLQMKKIAKAITSGQSQLSTMEDIVKPVIKAAEKAAMVALEVASLGAAGIAALGMAGGGAAAAGAGAGGGTAAMDLGMATPVAGSGGMGSADISSGPYLPPPRYDIVPTDSMTMAPPRALPGEAPRSTPTDRDPAAPQPGSPSPKPPASPAAPTAPTSPPRRDTEPMEKPEPAVVAENLAPPDTGTPEIVRAQGEGGIESWTLSNADVLRRAAQQRKAATEQPAASSPTARTGSSPVAANTPSVGPSAPSPGPAPTAPLSGDGGSPPPPTDSGYVDAQFRPIDTAPEAPVEPPAAPASRWDRIERFLEVRAATSPRATTKSYYALLALRQLRAQGGLKNTPLDDGENT